jgi:uncharacterized membrane protein
MSSGVVAQVIGVALLLLGAFGASVIHRRQQGRPGASGVLALAPFGILIGAGAALVRGWDLGLSSVAGALVVLLVALGGDVWAARRRSRSRHERD